MASTSSLVVDFSLSLPISQFLQVVGHRVASGDEQIEQGLLDRVKTGAAGKEDLVGCTVDENGFISLSALVLLGTQDNAEGVGEEHSGVGWVGEECQQCSVGGRQNRCTYRESGHGRRFRRPLLRIDWAVDGVLVLVGPDDCMQREHTCRLGLVCGIGLGIDWIMEEKEERWRGWIWRTIYLIPTPT